MSAYVPKQPSARQGASQNVALTAVSAASTAFGSQTYQIMIVATAASNVRVGNSPTATTSDTLLPANWPVFLTVSPGQQIAGVTASSATLNVTEMT